MGLITLPNVRATSDITVRLRLKDGGLAIDWSTLSNIKAWIYSDAQRAMAGRCETTIDADDNTILICEYSANKPQYLGINSIVVRATYHGRTKTYDKKFAVIVPRTDDVSGDTVLEDPVVDLELEVEDVSSSILDTIVAACIKATEEAQQVVDVHRGPQGESAYEVAVDNGFVGTEQEWLASLQGEDGTPGTPGANGHDGADGESAYQVAVDNGFVGTQAQWLASLRGNSGYTGAVGELEVVNNLEDGGATSALSAEMGSLLSRNMKLLYDSMGAAAFWGDKPVIDWSGNSVPVSITLTDCTIDNLASAVPLGDSYEATITPDAGSILGTVVCTMNGEPQTVANGHIYIAEVTGAIIISALGMNLDSVAYESLTYRQIFETNNYLGISPGFENGSYSPMTASTGSPSITDEDADSGDYSLKVVNSGGSNQIQSASSTKKGCYIACRAKVVNWSAGAVGMMMGIADYRATFSENTDWATTILHKPATSTSYKAFVGSFQYPESAGYVDTPVCILDDVFTDVPSLDVFTQLYENYVAIKKAA